MTTTEPLSHVGQIDRPTVEARPVSQIEFCSWNTNEMTLIQYRLLLEDMQVHGPNDIDPLFCVQKSVITHTDDENLLVVLNGNHRLRAAKELGWSKILVIVDQSIISEEEARAISYRKNAERGQARPVQGGGDVPVVHQGEGMDPGGSR